MSPLVGYVDSVSVQQQRLELDSSVRRVSKGTALLGGSPFRVMRLSASGARLLDRWLLGGENPETPAAAELRQRLIGAGIVHPVVTPVGDVPRVMFVVPVHNDLEGLVELLAALRTEFEESTIIVVDDCSDDAATVAKAASEFCARLLRHDENRGPAAARNTGWRLTMEAESTAREPIDLVAFVDADVVPAPGAMATLFAHFESDIVAAAAPRVRAQPGIGSLDAYESVESPLDLGDSPSPVRRGARVPYVPAAALVVRREALADSDGFDESLRAGEDVDFVWRLVRAGHDVRYEPGAVVHHRNRSTVMGLAKQRRSYGSSAAPLAQRHPGAVVPVDLPAQSLAVWTLAAFGGARSRRFAALVALVDALGVAHRLRTRVDQPVGETVRLVVRSHLNIGNWLARAVTRTWLPLFVPLLALRRFRRVVLAAMVLPPLAKWFRSRPAIDPGSFVVLSVVDDVAYCSGVWIGAFRARSAASILPRVRRPRLGVR